RPVAAGSCQGPPRTPSTTFARHGPRQAYCSVGPPGCPGAAAAARRPGAAWMVASAPDGGVGRAGDHQGAIRDRQDGPQAYDGQQVAPRAGEGRRGVIEPDDELGLGVRLRDGSKKQAAAGAVKPETRGRKP